MSRRIVSRIAQARPFVCTRCIHRQFADATRRRAFHASRRHQQSSGAVLDLLEERGYVNQIAGDRDALNTLLQSRKQRIYAGIDPTAPSLHLGHLLPLMVLFWASFHGNGVVSLVGGGTAKVGDPSGRLTSRENTTASVQLSNSTRMFKQVENLWVNAKRYALKHGYTQNDMGVHQVLNNEEWLRQVDILHFLRLLGNGMRLGTMLGRDT